jgi:hypothetical protein
MQALKHTIISAAILVQLSLSSVAVRAQNPFAAEPPVFQLTVQRENVKREPAPFRVFVTIGTNKFTFVTPDGFQVKDDPAQQRVILTSADQNCTMVINFGGSVPDGVSASEATACRNLLLKRHPKAIILNEFSATAGQTGPAFDLQYTSPGGISQTSRAAFIPSAIGTLEFKATGTADVQISFNTVLRTFSVSDANGKLDIPAPVSDQM